MKSFRLLFPLLFVLTACGPELPPLSDEGVQHIRLNQVGYYPGTVAQIYLTARPEKQSGTLVDSSGTTIVSELVIGDSIVWDLAGETVWPIQFDVPFAEGIYRIYVPGVGFSYDFKVAKSVYEAVFQASIKALYYQRASTALPAQYAGKWTRAMGHPDTAVLYHPSTGVVGDRTLHSSKGWYDAGDFGKYVVNGSFPVGQLLALYEDIGDPAPDGSLNIPESGNGRSDFLDELRWEFDWLVTMQDSDGGLFHKLTTKQFDGMVMPEKGFADRYAIGKGTAATLDFAAAAAQASRIYTGKDEAYGINLLNLAKLAWSWAKQYPSVPFVNPYDISTGEYGDEDFTAEWYWAAAELYLSTGENQYKEHLEQHPPKHFSANGSWTGYMEMLGVMSLLRNPDKVPATIYNPLKDATIRLADSLTTVSLANPYGQVLTDFNWGSNSDVLNAAMSVAAAYQLDHKPEYLTMVRSSVDYILGKNATGYSFVTGYGHRTPLHIHHRQSAADGIDQPIPGLLSGGPNSRQQDSEFAAYPEGVAPMQSWVDQEGSYASNEICLNWNAPLTYVLGWLEARE